MSCLFNSLQYFINVDSYHIRQMICDYLENNGKIIDGLDTKDVLAMENTNYISHMRIVSTWGGAIEIQAACNIWKLRVIVRDIRDIRDIRIRESEIEFLPISGMIENTIYLEWSGGHYEPRRS